MEFHLKFIGILLITLSMVHIIFPKYFNWKEELKSLSLINKQMMEVHTFFVAFVVLLMGLLCFFKAEALISTDLGKTISLGFGIFWLARLIVQFFYYSSRLWKGKIFETSIHILFSLTWVYLTTVFLINYTS